MKMRMTSLFAIAALLLTVGAAQSLAQQPAKDVIDTAMDAGTFKTLIRAAQESGMVATLKGQGPFTVFAPTDEAFAKLPAGMLDTLLKPENKQQLADILLYHVVAG